MYDINFYMKAYAFIKRIKKDGISKEAAALNFENFRSKKPVIYNT